MASSVTPKLETRTQSGDMSAGNSIKTSVTTSSAQLAQQVLKSSPTTLPPSTQAHRFTKNKTTQSDDMSVGNSTKTSVTTSSASAQLVQQALDSVRTTLSPEEQVFAWTEGERHTAFRIQQALPNIQGQQMEKYRAMLRLHLALVEKYSLFCEDRH